MNEENDPPSPPANSEGDGGRKILWLPAAFVPSAFGIASIGNSGASHTLLIVFISLNVLCSVAASVGLGKGMGVGTRFLLVFFFSPAFFVLNLIIVAFVGCSRSGGIG
jgi:hypothetical protein